MVDIESFFRVPDGTFVRASDCDVVPSDPDYVEGALELSVYGQELIGQDEWDYIDDLWCYISDMVPKVQSTGYAETYFPDQPIKLSFRKEGSRILVTATVGKEIRKASAASEEFLTAVRRAGLAFFDELSRLLPDEDNPVARQALSS
ncbi:hypothetical protein AB0B79_37480 [Streptomyces sp. NPDC039022]|uniref:hypothetical protein n=1 Tax=Streptomyces sp. NPDC039022 TaxID=3157091 RepID=UPI0033CBA39C